MNSMVTKAVDSHFRGPDAAKAAQRQVTTTLGTVVLVWAAWTWDSPVALALWVWVAYRVAVLAVLVCFGTAISQEVTRRLALVPPPLLAVLQGRVASPTKATR